jgi:hypothetical protein
MTIEPEQLRRASELYMDGKSTHEIADILGFSAPGIFKALVRIGVPMRDKKQAIKLAYSSSRYGARQPITGRWRGPSAINRTWTEDRIALLKKMWYAGKTGGEIAEALRGTGEHFTKNSVIGKARRIDLPARCATPKPRASIARSSRSCPTARGWRWSGGTCWRRCGRSVGRGGWRW